MLVFNKEKEEVIRRLQSIDIVCTDLDECLFPFFTQLLVSGEILIDALAKRECRKYLWPLVLGAFHVLGCWLITFGNIRRLGNIALMKKYEKTMKGIPMELIERHSQYIHSFFYKSSLEFLKKIRSRNTPVVIISLSVQPILDVIKDNIDCIDSVMGNKIKKEGSPLVFSEYKKPYMSNASDKLAAFNDLCAQYNASKPLVIGHSEEEMAMVEKTRSLGGLSIGINPKKRFRSEFDIVLQSISWQPLLDFYNTSI